MKRMLNITLYILSTKRSLMSDGYKNLQKCRGGWILGTLFARQK